MKRYAIKDFSTWKVNEGIVDSLINFAKKIPGVKWLIGLIWDGENFQGPAADFLNNFTPDGMQDLPEGVVLKPCNTDEKVLSNVGINVKTKPYFADADANAKIPVTESNEVSEAVVGTGTTKFTKGMRNVGYAEFRKIIESHVRSAKRGVILEHPPFCWGAPGLGKTSIVYSVAKEKDMRVVYANLQTVLPEDLFMPTPDGGERPKKWLPVYDSSAPNAKELEAAWNGDNGGIIFFDELPRAIPATQDVFIKFLNERRINEWRIPSKWVIIAAGNRPEDDPKSGFYLSSALTRRIDHFNLDPNPNEFISYASSKKDPDYPDEDLDYILPEILAFISFKNEYFHKNDPDNSRLYPNPAAWRNATSKINAARKDAEEDGVPFTYDDIKRILHIAVGEEVANEMEAFFELSKIPGLDLDKLPLVFTNPSAAPLPPKSYVDKNDTKGYYRPDIIAAFLSNIAMQKRKEEMSKDDFDNLAEYCRIIGDPVWVQTLITTLGLISPSFAKNVMEYGTESEEFALTMQKNFPSIYEDIIKNANFDSSNIIK